VFVLSLSTFHLCLNASLHILDLSHIECFLFWFLAFNDSGLWTYVHSYSLVVVGRNLFWLRPLLHLLCRNVMLVVPSCAHACQYFQGLWCECKQHCVYVVCMCVHVDLSSLPCHLCILTSQLFLYVRNNCRCTHLHFAFSASWPPEVRTVQSASCFQCYDDPK